MYTHIMLYLHLYRIQQNILSNSNLNKSGTDIVRRYCESHGLAKFEEVIELFHYESC